MTFAVQSVSPSTTNPEAIAACLQMFSGANFPVGTKKRISRAPLGRHRCGVDARCR